MELKPFSTYKDSAGRRFVIIDLKHDLTQEDFMTRPPDAVILYQVETGKISRPKYLEFQEYVKTNLLVHVASANEQT